MKGSLQGLAMVAIAAAVTVMAALSCVPEAAADRLNQHVADFAPVSIHPLQTMRQGRYTREKYLHEGSFSFSLDAFDDTFRFDLQPHTSLHSKDLKVYSFRGSEKKEVSLNDRKYYFGHVNHNTSEFCHFRVGEDGSVHGFFRYNGEKYAVDPSEYHFAKEQAFNHVVYRLSDHDYIQQPQMPAHCGVSQKPDQSAEEAEALRMRRAAFEPGNTVCDIGVVADSLFFQNIGNSDIGRTIDKMTQRFAEVEEVYEEFNEVTDSSGSHKIGISIGYLEVIEDPNNDPYNTNQNHGEDGQNFLRHVSTNPNEDNSMVRWDDYCLVHLLTDQEFSEGLLGLAWVGSADNSPGGICQDGATLSGTFMYTNTGFSTQTNYGARVPDLTAYLVMAHEIGHNFGSPHDEQEQTSGGQYLMWPVSVDGSADNNYLLSPMSLMAMGEVITAKGGCFLSSDQQSCGNNVQEGTEPCDCGSNENLCSEFDSCCAPDCNLASGAQCSPQNRQNGTCCTDTCTLITDTTTVCREETACTLEVTCTSAGACPDAPNRDNDTVCASDRLCLNGQCMRSICALWELEPAMPPMDGDPCLVYCDPSNPRTTDNLTAPVVDAQRPNGTTYTVPSDAIALEIGSLCYNFDDNFYGQCNDKGNCVSTNGEFIFDDIEDFLKNASLDDLKDWALRTDAYIPNWAWLVIGFGILIILIVICCVVSNKMDAKRSSAVV